MATTPPANNPNALKLDERHLVAGLHEGLSSDMTPNHIVASMTTRSVNSAFTVKRFANVEESVEVSDYILELQKAGNEVVDGNLGRLERMLTSQTIALDTIFNKLAEVHDCNFICDVAHHSEVMRNEDERKTKVILQAFKKVKDLRLDRNIKCRNRLVCNDDLGIEGKCARNANTLPLPAGKLMRISF